MAEVLNRIVMVWMSLDVQLRIALIGAGATMLAATFAALVVAWQVRAQAKNAIAQSVKSEATKLKLQIYERILEICDGASQAQLNFTSAVRMFPYSLSSVKFAQENNFAWTPPAERYITIAELRGDAQVKSIGIITAVEKWGIADRRMAIFQIAMNAALHGFMDSANRYFQFSMTMFPAPRLDDPTKLFPWQLPSQDRCAELQRLTDEVIAAVDAMGNYVHDFRVEMQRSLLGDLFPNGSVIERDPLDPQYKVIRLKDHVALTRYFENDTEWGQNAKRIRADVLSRLQCEPKLRL